MKRIRSFYRKYFYPEKKTRSLCFHFIFTLLMIGLLMMGRDFVENYIGNRYEYFPANVIYEENEDWDWEKDAFDRDAAEAEFLRRGEFFASQMGIGLKEVKSKYYLSSARLSIRSTENKVLTVINGIHFSDEFETYVSLHSEATFEWVKKFSDHGVYISDKFAENLGVDMDHPRVVFSYGRYNAEEISFEVAGIFRDKIEGGWNSDVYARTAELESFAEWTNGEEDSISADCLYRYERKIGYDAFYKVKQMEPFCEAKAEFIQYYERIYGNFFTLSRVYLLGGAVVMTLALILIAVDLESGMRKIRKTEQVFYRSGIAVTIDVGKQRIVPLLFSVVVSSLVLLLLGALAKGAFGFYLFPGAEFFLLAALECLIVVSASVLASCIGLKK